jgi:cobalt/nickel transport system permease protein
MHMADALISPAVGGTLWIVSGGLLAFCARKVKDSARDNLVPLMGVLGAFVFAAQMINFTIPGTGSSGHLGGGLMLAVLLGPHAAFLVIASVLTVQAFFFADGGLLALGCNIFNLGFFPAFVAYPLIYRVLSGSRSGAVRGWIAPVIAAVVGLQLGAFSVVLETRASGISDLSFGAFLLLMLPIHLAIGVVEGLATAAVVAFVAQARPDALPAAPQTAAPVSLRPVLVKLAVAAVVVGGVASWFASTHPDGLEWSIAKVTGREEVAAPEAGIHQRLSTIQGTMAILPDYGFKAANAEAAPDAEEAAAPAPWPAVSAGTSVSGLVGGLLTLALACLAGVLIRLCAAPKTRKGTP